MTTAIVGASHVRFRRWGVAVITAVGSELICGAGIPVGGAAATAGGGVRVVACIASSGWCIAAESAEMAVTEPPPVVAKVASHVRAAPTISIATPQDAQYSASARLVVPHAWQRRNVAIGSTAWSR